MTSLVKYSHLDEHREFLSHNRYAAAIVFNILDRFLTIDSILDLGCGIGVWMQAALAKPGRTVLGVDLETFAPEDLVAPSETIVNTAIDRPVELHRRFDLTLCLETAEHIQPERATEVVSNCVRHSDIILFSAAIPGQGGLHHINEQPPEYWQCLFDQAGYDVVDIIRPLIWCDPEIPLWYRQNMLLFVNRKAASTLELLRAEAAKIPIPLQRAHPDLVHWQAQELARYKAELHEAEQQRTRLQRREGSDSPKAKLRSEELQADLDAQNEYSRQALFEAWQLIHRLRSEREAERVRLQTIDRHRLAERLAAAEAALANAMEGALVHAEGAQVQAMKGQLSKALSDAERDKLAMRQQFLSSLSWRVTAPLRLFGKFLLRLKIP